MPDAKANIFVVFYSRDGSVEALAKAVSEGARQAEAEVRLRRVPDIVSSEVMARVPGWEERSKKMLAEYGVPTPADAEWADGIIFCTPTRFGNTSAEGHGTPYGALSISGQNNAPPTADELEVAKHQGARITQVAAALKEFSRRT